MLNERALPALQQSGVKPIGLEEERPAIEGETNLGTMHRAKGLEFRAVAVIACDTAHVPDPNGLASRHDPADRKTYLEHERNLLYVACTRARERLLVSRVGKPAEGLVSSERRA